MSTVMLHITSTMDHVHDGGPIRLYWDWTVTTIYWWPSHGNTWALCIAHMFGVMLVEINPLHCKSYKGIAHTIMCSTEYMIMITNNYALVNAFTILYYVIIVLVSTPSTYQKHVCCNTVCHVTLAAASCISCLLHLFDCIPFFLCSF